MLHLNYPPCHRAETYASVLSKHEILINKGVLNYFFKDDASTADLSEPFTETLNPSEKEVAMILGPQTFTGIPGGHNSMVMFGENKYYKVCV